MWIASILFQCVLRDLRPSMQTLAVHVNVTTLFKSLSKWTAVTLKVTLVGGLWLSLPPLLVGLFVDAFFIVPLKTPLNETPLFGFGQCWVVGAVMLKIWVRCVLSGVFGDIPMRTHLEHIFIRGLEQFDATVVLVNVVLPVLTILLDFTVVPHCMAQLAGLTVRSYLLRTVLVRFCLHIYIASRLTFYFVREAQRYLVTVHKEIRDQRYLVGTQLTNRGGRGRSEVAVEDAH